MDALLFILAGAFAGVMSGLLGIGGGMVIVPTLSMIFSTHMNMADQIVMHMASGTALCIMIFTSMTSVYANKKSASKGHVYFREIVPFLVVGIVFGALMADQLSSQALKTIFGFFILFIAFEMQFGRLINKSRLRVSNNTDGVIVAGIGMMSGMLGIGGAVLLIPYLSRRRMPLRTITKVSALSSLTAGIVGTIAVMLTGLNHTYPHEPWSIGYVYLPAVVLCVIPSMFLAKWSASRARYVSIRYLKLFFVIFLAATSLRMIW